jgi:uncharacterized protein (DUF58 family)
MLLPSRRLILLSLLLLPAALLPALHAGTQGISLALALLLLLLALVDASRSLHLPPALRIGSLPDIRQAKNQEGRFSLPVHCLRSLPSCRLGIAFPTELGTTEDVKELGQGREGELFHIDWDFMPRKRGLYNVRHAVACLPSPLGLWDIHQALEAELEFHIYPDLRLERRSLANLFLNRGLDGSRRQRSIGRGRDYDQIREYRPGDTPTDIHWKASAKRSVLVAKTYQIERTQELVLAIDHSRLSARPHPLEPGGEPEPVLERYVAAANLLAMAALREGDLFGLMTFARTTDCFVRASSGASHLRTLQNSLFTLQPENVYPDIDEWVRFTRVNLRRRSLLILLTDLSDASTFELLEKRIRILSSIHVVVVAMIPPPGVHPLLDKQHPPSDPWTALAGHLMWRDLQHFRTRLHDIGIPLLLSAASSLVPELVNEYLHIKQRQSL